MDILERVSAITNTKYESEEDWKIAMEELLDYYNNIEESAHEMQCRMEDMLYGKEELYEYGD